MTDHSQIIALIQSHGLTMLTALAVVEGPIVTVIAAWLASMSLLRFQDVFICVLLADLVGDTALYLAGRFAPQLLSAAVARRLGLTRRRVTTVVRSFRERGWRILLFGKLTHAAGFAVLAAAGAARMPFLEFLMVNLAATIPKVLVFMGIGYLAGSASGAIGEWLGIVSAAVIAIIAMAIVARWRQVRAPQE
jgi:membrane-associated protein